MLRVLFGFLLTISCIRFMMLGWIHDQYVAPVMHFPYPGFTWVTTLGEPGMYVVFGLMLTSAICVMLGYRYRIASVLLFLTFTYVELIDKTYYLNHYYFVSISAFLMMLLPAHRSFSLDVVRKPDIRLDEIPAWMVDVLKLQLAIVYFHAGVAKINHDWLIEALPLRIWMPANDTLPVVGPLMTVKWMPWVFSWFGMIYDVTIAFFLYWRRTRPFAYLTVIVFHVVTGMMFQIGVFPVVMIGMTLVFFEPSTHQRIIDVLKALAGRKGADAVSGSPRRPAPTSYRWLLVLLSIHLVVQLLVPWRYLLYPGNLFWSEEGYRFSWRVMLMEKAGTATFYVKDRVTGREGQVVNGEFLNTHQEKQMSMQPDMVLQFAHFLHDHYAARGITDPVVRAEVWVTMNGRPSRLLVDSTVDLSREQEGFHHYAWVLPND
ncbi:MAG: HTTM domain-containing protein ['Candidatus Kapabacteria' thiocyanatum]|uniref:HTTM domain-containing protein n=1 Tax=Candidatus Kapaibacterium thiocyanatum TaxID=1895771 RepID=A0A1M3L1L8_9BACT|nr:HTTM domain-containing protein ['Candidatus Kapabacteria' thiocyanatum]OJX58718.1 MAG: HTTM domain-containing protein ['Candidatus Kapabacteria' thiocyanatum]